MKRLFGAVAMLAVFAVGCREASTAPEGVTLAGAMRAGSQKGTLLAPETFTVAFSNNQLTLTWSAVTSAEDYHIQMFPATTDNRGVHGAYPGLTGTSLVINVDPSGAAFDVCPEITAKGKQSDWNDSPKKKSTPECITIPGTTPPPVPPIVTDNSPPVITYSIEGTEGLNGWYTSDVTVTWTVNDPESTATITSGCVTSTVSSDTQSITFNCSASSAGGDASQSVTIKRDATPPVVSGPVIQGPLGNNGWYTGPVSVTFTTSDEMSGVLSRSADCTAQQTEDTPEHVFTCTATDNAGLTASATTTIKLDATKPVVSYAGNLGSYTVDLFVDITCSATDATSGIDTDTCADITGEAYTFAIGLNSFSATASDNAGNENSAATSFTVVVTAGSLCNLVKRFATDANWANSLCVKLNAAAASAARGNITAKNNQIGSFINEVKAQSGKKLSAANATLLITLAGAL